MNMKRELFFGWPVVNWNCHIENILFLSLDVPE